MVHIRAPMLSLLMLLAVGLLATHASARPSRRRCCTTYGSGSIPFNAIRGYSVQTDKENCSINAIIFHTKKGMETCANPAEDWVMRYIENLRNKAQKMHGKKTPGSK